MNASSESPAGNPSGPERFDRISIVPMPDYSLYSDRDLIAVADTVDGTRFPERRDAILSEIERRSLFNSAEQGVTRPPMSRARILLILRIIGGVEIAVASLAMAFALLAGVNGWFTGLAPITIVMSLMAVFVMLVAGILTCFGSFFGITLSMLLAFLQLIGQLPLPFPATLPPKPGAAPAPQRVRYEMVLDIVLLGALGYFGTQLKRRNDELKEN